MLHARIAARAFNTPLLVEPSKAMAFLSGFGPRVLGRRLDGIDALDDTTSQAAALPARRAALAGVLTGGVSGDLAEAVPQSGNRPYPVIDGIAVIEISGVLIHRGAWIGNSSGQTSYEGIAAQIEAAATDPAVRGVALEIDSFGGEVAGVFDLADRIRALGRQKPVWAFVAEHAFSAGYALASQANRILLPRTGAVGSIGVVVMHADLSGQLDQEGVRVTLVHAGRHKVDANPYEPLAPEVQDGIQREIEVLRFLFAETVAAGRGSRLTQDAALATEAATVRGTEAVDMGLADEVIDLASGFAAFRQHVAGKAAGQSRAAIVAASGAPVTARRSAACPSHPSQTQTREDTRMDPEHDPDDSAPENGGAPVSPTPTQSEATETPAPTSVSGLAVAAPRDTRPVAVAPGVSPAPTTAASAVAAAPAPEALAALSAQLREAAAEIAEIAAQAARLGITVDTATALRDGTMPEALRRLVLERAAAAADARDIVAAPPAPARTQTQESAIVAAAKRAASAGKKP